MKNEKKDPKSWVSRSEYMKVCEENKRLEKDIYTMVMMPVTGQSILVKARWEDKFTADKELAQLLHEAAVQYVRENPDSIPAKIAEELNLLKGVDQL